MRLELQQAFEIFQQNDNEPLMPWLLQGDHICRQPRPHRLATCPWGSLDDNGAPRLPDDLYTEADARRDTPDALNDRLRSGGQLKPR
jgi:hypothetical protein